jgi:hypothetical protein
VRDTQDGVELLLWCQPEGFVEAIVYGGNAILSRPRGDVAIVAVDESISRETIVGAAERATRLAGGAVRFSMGAGAVPLRIRYDPTDEQLIRNGWAAYTADQIEGGWIVGADVVLGGRFAEERRPQQLAILTHELGHVFGLGHHNFQALMNPATLYAFTDFTDLERGAGRMVIVRSSSTPPSVGQLPPDTDWNLAATSSTKSRRSIIGCSW